MRRHLSIRWRVLTALALPVLIVVLACGAVSLRVLDAATQSRQTQALVASTSRLDLVTTALQAERLAAVAPTEGESPIEARMATDRALIDADLPGIESAQTARGALTNLREEVDEGASIEAVLSGYAQVIDDYVDLPARTADELPDREVAEMLAATTQIARAREATARIEILGLLMIRAGGATPAEQNRLAVAIADHDRALQALDPLAELFPPTVQNQLADAVTRFRGFADDIQRRAALPIELPSTRWIDSTELQTEALSQMTDRIEAAAAATARVATERAEQRVRTVVSAAAALAALVVLLALWQSHSIAARVRSEDRVAADHVAEQDEQKEAAEQGDLHAAFAETLINISRRTQVLLARQLAFIDRLERAEHNAGSLDALYRLDHLATRMRRNAESLLMLAGIDSGRRARAPMPLSDVVRTAISEIEQFERVDLEVVADPVVVAHLALPTAHLIAELVENGTLFSDPSVRVRVRTTAGAEGIEVQVLDHGLGMSEDDLAEANERLRDPRSATLAQVIGRGTQRIGLYAVTHLATRLGAIVSLAAGEQDGTVVRVVLPAAVFVEGSAPITGPPSTGQLHEIDLGTAELTEPEPAEPEPAEPEPAEPEPAGPAPIPLQQAMPPAAPATALVSIPATMDVLPDRRLRSNRSYGSLFTGWGRRREDRPPDAPPSQAESPPSTWLAPETPDDGTRWGWAGAGGDHDQDDAAQPRSDDQA